MLEESLVAILPYIQNIEIIKKFIEENKDEDIDTIIKNIDEIIIHNHTTATTDYKILKNELEKRKN
jgi:hypothetical protein